MSLDQLLADLRGWEPDQADQREFDAEVKLTMSGALKRTLQRVAEHRGVSLRHLCREVLTDAAMARPLEVPTGTDLHMPDRAADPMPRPTPERPAHNDDAPAPGALATSGDERCDHSH